jgi:hypothetical protein
MYNINEWNKYFSTLSSLWKFKTSTWWSCTNSITVFTQVWLSKIFYFYLFLFFYSETNDSTDYLRLLNSIWNDHTVRSVSDINQINFFLIFFFRFLFVSYLLFLIVLMFYMQLYLVFGIYLNKINSRIFYLDF